MSRSEIHESICIEEGSSTADGELIRDSEYTFRTHIISHPAMNNWKLMLLIPGIPPDSETMKDSNPWDYDTHPFPFIHYLSTVFG